MQDDSAESQLAALEGLGLTYTARFVPQSQSRNWAEKQPSLNWFLTFAKGKQALTVEYTQGIGHLPGYVHSSANKLAEAENIRYAVEFGKWDARHDKAGFRTAAQWLFKAIAAPTLADALQSLTLDCEVLNHACFEDWAGDYGYDKDSRAAEATYKRCLAIALQFRAMVGEDGLRTLREVFNGE